MSEDKAKQQPTVGLTASTSGQGPLDTQELLVKIKGLESRDYEGWTIAALGILALAVALLAVYVPDAELVLGRARFNGRFILSLILILAVVVLLFNLQGFRRRQTLRNSRAEYVRQLLRADAAEQLALTDPLTGLFNRRHLEQFLNHEAKRSMRTGSCYSILMLDLVGFGELNRRSGHLEGDRVLRELSQILIDVFRQTDGVFRYGGDEFLVVLIDTDDLGAERARVRLLTHVERWNEAQQPGGSRILLAYGESTSRPGVRAIDVVRAADERLILMKRSGARRVTSVTAGSSRL
jgi:diguanylate cyclase (GGDEF)-like protein